jgi:hypothetical protein
MASHLPLRRVSSTVRFFRGVLAVRNQLAHTDGLAGYTLRARPVPATLACWEKIAWRDRWAVILGWSPGLNVQGGRRRPPDGT